MNETNAIESIFTATRDNAYVELTSEDPLQLRLPERYSLNIVMAIKENIPDDEQYDVEVDLTRIEDDQVEITFAGLSYEDYEGERFELDGDRQPKVPTSEVEKAMTESSD
jgi:hypothetical protein